MNILFIVGAGASRAVSPMVPLMDDFLHKALNCLEEPSDEACMHAFKALADTWIIDQNRYGGSLWNRFHREYQQQKYIDGLKEQMSFAIDNSTMPGMGRIVGLEDAFKQAESKWKDDEGNAFLRLTHLISWLFAKLDIKLAEPLKTSTYHFLAEFIAKHKSHTFNFISLNYDVWLEQALFAENSEDHVIWEPSHGYGHNMHKHFAGYINFADRMENWKHRIPTPDHPGPPNLISFALKTVNIQPFPHSDKPAVQVLKPHGSLCWMRKLRDSEDPPVILVGGQPSPRGHFNVVNCEKTFDLLCKDSSELIPQQRHCLILPPATNKSGSGQLFWELQRQIQCQIQSADCIVLIGWSCPNTDSEIENRIRAAIDLRSEQLPLLIICNKRQAPPFYMRFEGLFRPKKNPIIYDEGFSKDFVENVLTHQLIK